MFAPSYFPGSYFPGGYFTSGGGDGPEPPEPIPENRLPTFPCLAIQSEVAVDDGQRVDYSDDGTPHIRRMYSIERYNLSIVQTGLTLAQRNTLRDFYRSYRGQVVEVLWQHSGETYNAYLLSYREQQPNSGVHWNVTILARGVLA